MSKNQKHVYTEWAPRPIKSISCDLRDLSVCPCMAYLCMFLGFWRFSDFLEFKKKSVFWGLCKPATVHIGGISRGRVCGCGCRR